LLLSNRAFGFRQITVERPLRNDEGEIVLAQRGKAKGKPQADSSLRDTEIVPLTENVDSYFQREVIPHAPDAWIDEAKTKIGYEIPFNRHFYVFEQPRDLEEIDAELSEVTKSIQRMLVELAG
jgi:type I restriction enzyme M protein